MADAFDTLGLAPRFDIDASELANHHRELSRALHPDRYASAPAAERRMALGRAIEVNEAFRALRDPVKRAEALARRAGLPVGETSEPRPSPDLLMEMMESREALAEAARKKDAAAIAALGAEMQARGRTVEAAIGAAFTSDPQKVLPLLGELRYVRRYLDEVSAFEESLLEG